jgi:hypothetical protein
MATRSGRKVKQPQRYEPDEVPVDDDDDDATGIDEVKGNAVEEERSEDEETDTDLSGFIASDSSDVEQEPVEVEADTDESDVEWTDDETDSEFDLDNLSDSEDEKDPKKTSYPPEVLAKRKLLQKMTSETAKLEANESNLPCSICRQSLKQRPMVTKLYCKHSFHPHCITPWFYIKSHCPVCSFPINPDTAAIPSNTISIDADMPDLV